MDGGSSRLDSSHEDLGGMSSGDESANRSASYSSVTKQKIELGRAKVRRAPQPITAARRRCRAASVQPPPLLADR